MAITNNKPAKNYENLTDEELMADIDDFIGDQTTAYIYKRNTKDKKEKDYIKSNKRGKNGRTKTKPKRIL